MHTSLGDQAGAAKSPGGCRSNSTSWCRSQYYMNLLQVVSCLAVPKHAFLLFALQTPAAATG